MTQANVVANDETRLGPNVRVTVIEHYSEGHHRIFEGQESDVLCDLLESYPWLASRCGQNASVVALVRVLDRAQAFSAGVHTVLQAKS